MAAQGKSLDCAICPEKAGRPVTGAIAVLRRTRPSTESPRKRPVYAWPGNHCTSQSAVAPAWQSSFVSSRVSPEKVSSAE